MFTQSAANQFLPTHMRTDPVRAEERARVRVKFHGFGASQFLAGGQLVNAKRERNKPVVAEPYELTVYASEFSEIVYQLESDIARLEEAQSIYLRDLRSEVVTRTGCASYEVESADVEDWPEDARKWAKERTALSVEASFYRLTGHGLRPLASAEIVEMLPAPPDEQAVALARTISAIRAAESPDVSALQAQIAALTAQVEKLTKKG